MRNILVQALIWVLSRLVPLEDQISGVIHRAAKSEAALDAKVMIDDADQQVQAMVAACERLQRKARSEAEAHVDRVNGIPPVVSPGSVAPLVAAAKAGQPLQVSTTGAAPSSVALAAPALDAPATA